MSIDQKRILLAVDGSSQSLEAVRYASKVFPSQQIRVVLFHVLAKVPEFFYDLGEKPKFRKRISTTAGWEIILRESISKFMSEAREILIDAGIPPEAITTNIHERDTGIARDIVRESNHGYSAVVLGRNGLNKINDFVLGSIATKLLERLAQVSVCVVGGTPATEKMLLALDQSEGAMRAAEYVGATFDRSAFELTLFRAVRGFNIYQRRYGNTVKLDQEQEWLEAYEMESVFEEAKKRLEQKGFNPGRVKTKLIKGVSSRAGAIVGEAREGGYGTIVVGRRGVSKVQEFFMGRVGKKVVDLATQQAVWVVC